MSHNPMSRLFEATRSQLANRTRRSSSRRRRSIPVMHPEQLEGRVLLSSQPLTIIDPSFYGDSGSGSSFSPSLSADGQRVAFVSDANNLVPGDTNGAADVFLYDRGTGRISLVSVNAAGTGPADLGGSDPQISADGRYVVFVSRAANLVSPPVNHPVVALRRDDVYVRDLVDNVTILVSRNVAGDGDGDSNSNGPSISADGRFVAFVSSASNVVSGDTNGVSDVFVRDLHNDVGNIADDATILVSAARDGGFANRGSSEAAISGNGQFVVFGSNADDLTNNDSNTTRDLFLRDLKLHVTKLVTADVNNEFSANSDTSHITRQPISFDGRYVVFQSSATNLVPENTAVQGNAFIRDTQNDTTRLLSVGRGGTTGSNGSIPIITPNGQFAAFVSSADTVASDVEDHNGKADIYESEITPTTITNRLVSVNSAGTNGGNASVATDATPSHRTLRMSPDGRFVGFTSMASDLDASVTDSNAALDVFVRDMQLNVTHCLSITADGTVAGNGAADTPIMSDDGRFVAFADAAADLRPNDRNVAQDIFLRDLTRNVTALVSARTPLLPAEMTAPSDSHIRDVSADGRYVLYFTQDARKIVPSVRASAALVVLDRESGAAQVVDVLPDGVTSSNGSAPFAARISPDGRFVAFASNSNILDATVTGKAGGVYVRDLLTGVTKMVSRNSTTGAPADLFHGSIQIAISADGRYVAFTSDARNLVDGVDIHFFAAEDGNLYLHDRQTGETQIVSRTPGGGAAGNGITFIGSYHPQFSADGRTLVYASGSSDLVDGVTDTNNAMDLFAYDIATGVNSLVSVSTTPGVAGNAASASDARPPFRVSGDGRWVYFASAAANLTELNNKNQIQIYGRDLVDQKTEMISVDSSGTAGGDAASHTPVLSADGNTLLFQSSARNLTDLPGGSFVQHIYVRDLKQKLTTLVSVNALGTAGGNGGSGNMVGVSDDPQAKLSADGRFVAFQSRATDLVPDFVPGSNGADLYVRDLESGTTVLATTDYSGIQSANVAQDSSRFRLANDTVVFDTAADNLSILDRNRSTFSSPADIYAFTFVGAGTISGRVFDDLNANQLQEDGEAGIPFWTVFIDANHNRRFDEGETRVFTNRSGDYRLTNLAAGTYSVGIVVDDGFVATAPDGPFFYDVTLDATSSIVKNCNFGAHIAPVDLAVGDVSSPAAARSGSFAEISWLVRNIAGTAAVGSWQDAVYFSTDDTLDAGDTLLATIPHTGGLAPFENYTASATVTLPAALPGNYFLLVQTDRRHQVTADTNRHSNILPALAPTALSVPALALNMPTRDAFAASGDNRYFQFTVPAGETLNIALDSTATSGAAELYVSRFHLPTTSDFDLSSVAPQPDQSLTIPATVEGTYYVLAHGAAGAAAVSDFTISAHTIAFGLDSIALNTGGNTGRVTVEAHGARLTEETQINLVSGATTIPALAINYRDPTLLYATFDLTGRAAGTYDVVATDGVDSASLGGGFTVVAGVSNPLDIRLSTPGALRVGRVSSAIVEIMNTGNVDVPAPLLDLSVTNATVRLEDQRDFTGDFTNGGHTTFLGISQRGPAGVLRPGERNSVRLFFTTEGGEHAAVSVQFEISQLFTTTSTIDWAAQQDFFQPASIPDDAWSAIYANFTSRVGATTGSLLDRLDQDASYLGELGVRTADVNRLLSFEFQLANDFLPGPVTASAEDDSLAAPGLELSFGRVHLQSLSGRYGLGALGRGWTDNWEIAANTDAQGNVLIQRGGGLQFFAKQDNGSYLGAPGNYSSLTLSAGVLTLREKDGTLVVFRRDGKLDYVADPHNNRITAGYNTSGQLATLTHSSGPSLMLTYNTAGRLEQVSDSAGRTTTYAYDATNEHLLNVTTVEGTTTYSYVSGQGAAREHALASVTDIDGTHTFFDYDERGRQIGQHRDGNAESVALSYDDVAGVTFTDAVAAATTVLFNDAGQPELVRDPLGRTSQFNYDQASNPVRFISPSGATTSYAYDQQGNLTRSVNRLGQETDFTYDPQFNQLASVRDAKDNTTHYAYDGQGNLLSITYPNGSLEQFSYDPLGNLLESVNRRGHAISFETNSRGLITRKTYADGTRIDFTYDDRDNLRTAVDGTGTTSLEYDGADRLTRIEYPNGRFLKFTYDTGGRRIQSVDQTGFTVQYHYDSVGRLAGLKDGSDAAIVDYTYDDAGRLIRKALGNGTFTTYDYDAASQLLHLINHAPDGAVNSRFDYTYDANGLRTQMSTVEGVWTYAYDDAGQLTHAVFTSQNAAALPNQDLRYAYDAVGNRTHTVLDGVTTTYATNNLNQYTTAGDVSYTYDADGNLLSRTDATSTTSYTWDDDNRLRSVVGPDGILSYQYDPFGNRSAVVRAGLRTEFLVDPSGLGDVVAEFDGSGNLQAHYTHGLGLISRVDQSGAAYFDFDALGSTAGITGPDGAYVNRYAYEPFGRTITLAHTIKNEFTFVGEFGVSTDGNHLLFMRERFYDSTSGQFMSNDPIGIDGRDVNLRRYVGNQPTGYVDSTGLAKEYKDLKSYEEYLEWRKEQPPDPDFLPEAMEKRRIEYERGRETMAQIERGYAERTPYGRYLKQALQERSAARNLLGRAGKLAGGAGKLLGGAANIAGAVSILLSIPEGYGRAVDLGKHFKPAADFGRAVGEALKPYLEDLCSIAPWLCDYIRKKVSALDPNDIVGPGGFDDHQQFIQPAGFMPYTIDFENIATATAPAQEVFVTQQLDSNLDWSTFELGDIGFGPITLDVPPGLQSYAKRVESQNLDGSPLFVDVSAGLNRDTGLVTWIFRSVDPLTGELPENALAGFLPPNDASHRGEGFLDYLIRQKPGLATGTTIDQQARIVFDTNDPIATNVWLNTIDAGAPTSGVNALPAFTSTTNFDVSWTGADDAGGSAVDKFNVYVSIDGGPFTLWQDETTVTAATYDGQFGHTYAFYSLAIDNVGLRSAPPAAAQATTSLVDRPVFDIDGNGGAPAPFTDGDLILAYLFHLPDAQLQPFIAADATRSAAEIRTYLDGLFAAGTLDIDGNALTGPFTDGDLALASLFHLADAQLQPFVAADATRTMPQIQTYLNGLSETPGAAAATANANGLTAVAARDASLTAEDAANPSSTEGFSSAQAKLDGSSEAWRLMAEAHWSKPASPMPAASILLAEGGQQVGELPAPVPAVERSDIDDIANSLDRLFAVGSILERLIADG